MKHFDEAATRAPLSFQRLVPALREAFAAEAQVPPRHVHAIETAGADKGTVLIMPAWSDAGFLGIKTINIFPGNGARGLPGLHATYVLYDARTGVPLAMMDGNEITARRTAAASALGASFLARQDARRLLVLGTGRIARMLPAAHASVRPIDEVWVWNHRIEGAQALAAQWRAEGWKAQAAPDLEAAVRHADIVCCATLATAPLVRGEWLAAGSHLDLIGSFTPAMREADAQCFQGARTFVDTGEALLKAGDLLDAMAAGTLSTEAIQGTLAELCRRECKGRIDSNERTVFKAVGSALEDLTAATLVWQQAYDMSMNAEFLERGSAGDWSDVAGVIVVGAPGSSPSLSTVVQSVGVNGKGKRWRIDILESAGHSPFKEVRCTDHFVCVGFGQHFYVIYLEERRVETMEVDGYFEDLYTPEDLESSSQAFSLLVASASELISLSPTGSINWHTRELGIDGVVIDKIKDGQIHGDGEWDPPGDWRPFTVDVETGAVISIDRGRW